MLLLGLFEESILISLLGVLLAICSRQTGLLLIPPMLLWLVLLWPRNRKRAAIFAGITATVTAILIYITSAYIALKISRQVVSIAHVAGFLTWMRGSPSIKALMEFGLRGIIGFTFLAATVLGTFPRFSSIAEWSRENCLRTGCLLGFAP